MGIDRSIPSVDLYGELGIDAGASTEAIEVAYRALMKRHHPDRAGPGGLARAKRLNLARDWLVDPERRARYDAAGRSRRTEALRPATRTPVAASAAGSRHPSTSRPSPTEANQAYPPWMRGVWPIGTAATIALGTVGIVIVVAASLVSGWGSPAAAGTGSAPPGMLGVATTTPTLEPTLEPTLAPTSTPTLSRTPTPTPTPVVTPGATPGSTAAPASVPAGHADIRFSGGYVADYDATLGGTSACTATTERGRSVPILTGFEIDPGTRSGSRWELTLSDLTVSWSMDIFFEDTADSLWWNSGVGVGSVTRTANGYAFDVVMTDAGASIRAKGTVTCK